MLDLYSLTADDFSQIVREFPEMHDILEDVAIERLSRLGDYSVEARVNQIKRYVGGNFKGPNSHTIFSPRVKIF